LGIWGGISGLAVAVGPVVGGAVVEGLSWQWIFWINVPIGAVLLPIAWLRLTESTGPDRSLDLPGLGLISAGLFGVVWGLVRGNEYGWSSPGVAGPIAIGVILLTAFVLWERRTAEPMVPLRFFRSRAFSAANVTSFLQSFGMFGAIFLLAQFLQVVQGYSPLEAGLRTLPWTGMPILVAPIAGMLSDRIGSRSLVVTGMGLMAVGLGWFALVSSPAVAYGSQVPGLVLCGVGMSLYFAPIANLVLSTVKRREEGKASGVNNAVREVGGVFGIAVLASVFSAAGGYFPPQLFVDGTKAALWIAVGTVALAGVSALVIPARRAVDMAAAPTPVGPAPVGLAPDAVLRPEPLPQE
jgi:EmrB/QacA subfamily drug resistance transporter